MSGKIILASTPSKPKRSDGKECSTPLFNDKARGGLCPRCKTNGYGITTAGHSHNSVVCSCGWEGCECELLEKEDETKQAVNLDFDGLSGIRAGVCCNVLSRVTRRFHDIEVEELVLQWNSKYKKVIWCLPKFEDLIVNVKGRQIQNMLVHTDFVDGFVSYRSAVMRVETAFEHHHKSILG